MVRHPAVDLPPKQDVSPALLAAQARLLERRAGLGIGEKQEGNGKGQSAIGQSATGQLGNWREVAGQLPGHLGWGSAQLTRHLRQPPPPPTHDPIANPQLPNYPFTNQPPPPTTQLPTANCRSPQNHTTQLSPTLALAFLRHRLVAPARLWLLLRHLDGDGCGWVSLAAARARLAGRGEPLRLCGWRQLRNLLRAGAGTFWTRSADRIWLRSTARVAAALGLERLHGRPVALPVAHLCAPIAETRAHFYAAFHSCRAGDHPAAPIARRTLTTLGGISRRSQRRYERAAGVRRQSNYAVAGAATPAGWQEAAWQRGRALFRLHDAGGRLGHRGSTYLAWQLPNSYRGPHALAGRGRQRRINRRLADLSLQGMTGNDAPALVPPGATRYFGNGRLAGRAYNRNAAADLYWRDNGRSPRNGRLAWWSILPGQSSP